MTYATGQTITTAEFNDFQANYVDKVWGIGSGDYGYGQTNTVGAVNSGNTITATQWTTLLARLKSAANHQGSTTTTATSVSTGSTISVLRDRKSTRLNSSH